MAFLHSWSLIKIKTGTYQTNKTTKYFSDYHFLSQSIPQTLEIQLIPKTSAITIGFHSLNYSHFVAENRTKSHIFLPLFFLQCVHRQGHSEFQRKTAFFLSLGSDHLTREFRASDPSGNSQDFFIYLPMRGWMHSSMTSVSVLGFQCQPVTPGDTGGKEGE